MMADMSRPGGAPWAELPEPVREALRADKRRIVVTGARGWVGRTLLELIDEALGPEAGERLACFGSARDEIVLSSGRCVSQAPLAGIAQLPCRPTMLFHLAFLTMDKVRMMSAEAYTAANRAISDQVLAALDPLGVDRLFVASSGAAAQADNPAAAADLQLYGALKRDDELRFAQWARAVSEPRRAAICRIFSVSGPFINKHTTYALADLILRGQRGEPVAVQSPRPVWRSYVAVSELVELALAVLLAPEGEEVQAFDTGGEPVELGVLAERIAAATGAPVESRAITDQNANRYCGDHAAWLQLLRRHGLEHVDLDRQIAITAEWLGTLDGGPHNV